MGTVTFVDRMKRVSGAQSSGIPIGVQPNGPAGAQSSGAGLPMPDRPSELVVSAGASGAQFGGTPIGGQPSGPAGAQSSGAGMPMPNRPSGLVGGLLVDHWTEYWIIERRLYHWTEYWITGRSVER